jgi:hypothetical protein
MGDYTKLIVNCTLKERVTKEKILSQLNGSLSSSYYHCQGELLEIDDENNLTLVNQHKYSNGIEGFLYWLKEEIGISEGIGERGLYAIVVREWGEPELHFLEKREEDEEN